MLKGGCALGVKRYDLQNVLFRASTPGPSEFWGFFTGFLKGRESSESGPAPASPHR